MPRFHVFLVDNIVTISIQFRTVLRVQFKSSSYTLNRELSNIILLGEVIGTFLLHFVYSYMAVTIFTPSERSTLEYTCEFFPYRAENDRSFK